MRATIVSIVAGWAVWRVAVRRPWPHRVPDGFRQDTVERSGPNRFEPVGRSSAASTGSDDVVGCTELLAVAVSAGCSLRTAILAVGAGGSGPIARGLAAVGAEVERGTPLEQALDLLARDGGPAAVALASTLSVAAGSGAPVAPALQRLADAERRRRRRSVEVRIRRLPVLLLLPLVGCVLPAFVVMTLVPAALSAAGSGGLAAEALPPPLSPPPGSPPSPAPPFLHPAPIHLPWSP